jgi:sulfate adenylyltransferase
VNNPHGLKLVNRLLDTRQRQDILSRKGKLLAIDIDHDIAREVENIAFGVYSPLEGFLCEEDFKSVLYKKRLANGIAWTIPIVLDLTVEQAEQVLEDTQVLLCFEKRPIAVLSVEEKYKFDKEEYAQNVYGTLNGEHPGVKRTAMMKEILVSGKIDLLDSLESEFENFLLRPKETRVLFKEKGWVDIAAFQTRNVPHVGHEYVQKAALTLVDGLFINPLIGPKKKGDFLDDVIIKSYKTLIDNYYLKGNVVMSILQTHMRYAGPREAIHHAIMRKNFGCTHFIVGRDHAGVGNFYHPFAAHQIFDEFPDLGIIPLFFKSFFKCTRCNSVVNDKICPHPQEFQVQFSGTKIRELLSRGELPPEELMRPEVAKVIVDSKNIFVGG